MKHPLSWAKSVYMGVAALTVLSAGGVSWAIITGSGLSLIKTLEPARSVPHVDQAELLSLVKNGQNATAFEQAFEEGDRIFGESFNTSDGVGANVGREERFTRTPRADRNGAEEWKNHKPARATGPNATGCAACHNLPAEDGAGDIAANVHRDPTQSAQLGKFIQRNTPHLFGSGGLQKLAEEMTADLQNIAAPQLSKCNCSSTTSSSTSCSGSAALTSKGVSFGTFNVSRPAGATRCTISGVVGVNSDLIVRPYQWKGSVAFLRDFVRGASHNELGMQGKELLGSPSTDPSTVDGDGDKITNEMTIGDMTALTVYTAQQPRPTTKQELAGLGIIPPLGSTENSNINAGSSLFDQIGCNSCHIRQLTVSNVTFREPSNNTNFRDASDRFPNGTRLVDSSMDPAFPVRYSLIADQGQENSGFTTANGQSLGAFKKDSSGRAVIELFGDLKRHDLGSDLAEQIDEVGTGAQIFMTENLWGVGSTAPYLHDGRAATLTEAILEHGGEGSTARSRFQNLTTTQQRQVLAFLNNLVLFKAEEEE